MSKRVLHILSQRPSRTGSGVTLEAMVRRASQAGQAGQRGWTQAVIVGVPSNEAQPEVGGLAQEAIRPLLFAPENGTAADLDFPVPGMSDVMPYPSTVWSQMSNRQLERYRAAWRLHLSTVIADFAPHVIHSHHIWLVSSMLKDLAPGIPVVATCHSTGLRQMELAPHLAEEVRRGCAQLDHFCVLRDDHRSALSETLGVASQRITVIGAGYRPDLFHGAPAPAATKQGLLYIGKYSHAKGLPWLLDAFTNLLADQPHLRLHVAGSGAGPEAEALRRRMQDLAPQVVLHGQLNQAQLAGLMRDCQVCVLPSFYEGVPLVLVEAAACGCRLVSTALPGVVERIAPHLAEQLELVPMPRLQGLDKPLAVDLPPFVSALEEAMRRALTADTTTGPTPSALEPFTWETVFGRVEKIWNDLTS